MLPSTRYELRIQSVRKGESLLGHQLRGHDYRVTIDWDSLRVLDALAHSPAALGRIVGECVRDMAESFEEKTTSRAAS